MDTNIPNADRPKILRKLFPFGLVALACLELTNPLAAATAGLLAATATTVAPQTVLGSALLGAGVAELAARPQNVTFTVAGTAAQSPTSAVITGRDIDGNVLTETVAITAAAATYSGVKAFKSIDAIVYNAAGGTAATVAIGFGNVFGLPASIKSRGGRLAVIQQVAVGAVVTTGTFVDSVTSGPHGTYSPATAPDGTKSYAVTFEQILS